MLPSIDNLRCFLLASRLLNFRKAARSAALTPAAFGQRIRHLEDELGVELFRRTTRSVSLTEAGMALIPHAERAIGAVEECVRSARGETGPPPMDLVLGTRHELGLSWILPQYDRLVRERPGLNLHLYFGSGSDLVLRVRTMEVDCAVTSTRISDPKLDSIRLHKEEYVLCGSRAMLAKNPLKSTEHAKNHVLFDVNAEMPLFRYWRDAPGGGDRWRFGQATWFGTIEGIRRMVVAGAGVAVLPEYLVRPDLAKRTLIPILPSVKPLHDYFRLVFRVDDPRRSVFEAIAATMLESPLS